MAKMPQMSITPIGPGRPPARTARMVVVAATSYAALFAVLLVQALRGIPITAPDTSTAVQFAAWAMATMLGAVLAWIDMNRAVRRVTAV